MAFCFQRESETHDVFGNFGYDSAPFLGRLHSPQQQKKVMPTILASTEGSIWAENGGLLGLVLFAFFGFLGVMFATFMKASSKKDVDHANSSSEKDLKNREFIQILLSDSREERKEDRSEHKEAYSALSNALSELTDHLRNEKSKKD